MSPALKRRALLFAVLLCAWPAGSQLAAQFRLEPRGVIEQRLKAFPTDNLLREETIHKWLAQSGCKKPDLSQEAVRVGLPPNVICVLPGESEATIVVGAHTDKVATAGEGVVDNWSGAALLPSLLYSLNNAKRHHTFVFVGFTAEEEGMVGSAYYVDHLSPERRMHIAAMVNMDSLGLAPTKVWASHADQELLDALASVATASKLPVAPVNVENVGSTDSESFAKYHIPRITLHSVTQDTIGVLHSANDKLPAIKMDDYYNSYRLIADYLAYLDDELPRSSQSPEQEARH